MTIPSPAKEVVVTTNLPISGSHQIVTRVEVMAGGNVVDVLTEVTAGSVELDNGAGSMGRCSITLPATYDLIPRSPWDLLAPFGNEIRISRGVELSDKILLCRLGIYRIEATRVSGDTITIEGLDRSGIFTREFGHQYQYGAGLNIRNLIIWILAVALDTGSRPPGVPANKFPDDPTPPTPADLDDIAFPPYDFVTHPAVLPWTITIEEQDEVWEKVQGLARAIRCDLYFNRYGVLVLRPIISELPPESLLAATYSEGPGGVLLSADRSWDRSLLTNWVQVTGQNIKQWVGPPAPAFGEAVDDNPRSPTYVWGRFGKKPMFYSNPFIGDNIMAQDCAEGILARSKGAPDSIEFDSIVDPGRWPNDVVRIVRKRLGLGTAGSTTPDDPISGAPPSGWGWNAQYHVLDEVSIPLSHNESMHCKTRALEESMGAPGPTQ